MFGNKLKQLRIKKNMNQQELADVFHILKSSISMYENNVRTPSLELAKEIAMFFNVSLDYMLGYIPSNEDDLQTIETVRRFLVKKGVMNNQDDLSKEKLNQIIDFIKLNKKFILTEELKK